MGADSSLVEVAGPERLGLRTGTEVATETSAGVGAWGGACGPCRGPPWLCQTPSIPARASVLRQQQETSGLSQMVTHGESHEGTLEMWAEGENRRTWVSAGLTLPGRPWHGGGFVQGGSTLVSGPWGTLPELEAPRGAPDCLNPDGSGGPGTGNPRRGGTGSPPRGTGSPTEGDREPHRGG